jgi:hypothetical protein
VFCFSEIRAEQRPKSQFMNRRKDLMCLGFANTAYLGATLSRLDFSSASAKTLFNPNVDHSRILSDSPLALTSRQPPRPAARWTGTSGRVTESPSGGGIVSQTSILNQ